MAPFVLASCCRRGQLMIRLGPLIGEMPVVGGITAYFNVPWPWNRWINGLVELCWITWLQSFFALGISGRRSKVLLHILQMLKPPQLDSGRRLFFFIFLYTIPCQAAVFCLVASTFTPARYGGSEAKHFWDWL